MASAAPTGSSTKETTNYARLCRLLVDIGTQALRETFDSIHPPANLHAVLAANKTTRLQSLRAKKIINPIQWGKLFPAIPTSVSSRDFDTTLLMVLLRNLCGLAPPLTGWDALPAVTDLSREADIVRVKYFRNTVYGHADSASVDDKEFNDNWRDIRDTLVRLGGVKYKTAIDALRNDCMDPEVEDHYRELLSQWKKDEDNIKDQLNDIMKRLDGLTSSKEITEEGECSMDGLAKCEETFHENEVLEYYCQECNVCICLKCGQTRHERHNKCEIQQAAEEQKVTMAQVVEEAKAEVVVVESKMDEQIELRNKSKARNIAAQDKVTEIVEDLIRVLKEHESNIKTKLVEIDETQEKDHEAQMKAFQMFAEKLKNSIERSEGVFQRGIAVEVLQEETCKDLLNQSQEMKLCKPEFVNYVPNGEVVNALTRLASGLGQVVTSNTDHSQSVAVGKGLKEAEVAIEANFTITTRDSERKQFYSEQDQVTATISSPTGEEEVQIRDCKDGNYTAHYQPKVFGRHDVQVEVNGWPLIGSPWIVDVKPHHYKVVSSCGSYGTEEGEFDEPWSVAKDEATGHIAVADFGNKQIQVFQEEWKYLRTIQGVKLGHPISVAFSKISDIIVTHAEDIDLHSLKLSAITDRGQFMEQFSEHLIKPYSVSVKNDGHGHVIVCDAGDKKIKVLSPDGVELLQSFCDPNCNRTPELALYHRDVFVVYYWAHCVKVFNEKGVYLYDIGSEESCEECLIRPVGLAVDSFHNLIVCDTGNWRLKVFTLDGKFVTSIADEIKGPWFVTVCKNGDVMVADAFKHCIHVLQ